MDVCAIGSQILCVLSEIACSFQWRAYITGNLLDSFAVGFTRAPLQLAIRNCHWIIEKDKVTGSNSSVTNATVWPLLGPRSCATRHGLAMQRSEDAIWWVRLSLRIQDVQGSYHSQYLGYLDWPSRVLHQSVRQSRHISQIKPRLRRSTF